VTLEVAAEVKWIVVPDLFGDLSNGIVALQQVGYAAEMAENNPRLKEKVNRIFQGAERITVPHQELLGAIARTAKFIVRTGAFDPWGNILLYSGVDVPKWFEKAGTVVPPAYQSRMQSGT
jgi:D-ribose pyranase